MSSYPQQLVVAAGVDLADLARLGTAMRRSGAGFRDRVMTPAEIQLVGDDPVALAGLFGAKEAVVKLMGGLPSTSCLRDIELAGVPGDQPGPDTLLAPAASARRTAAAHRDPIGADLPRPTAVSDHGGQPVRLRGAALDWARHRRLRVRVATAAITDQLILAWALATPTTAVTPGEL